MLSSKHPVRHCPDILAPASSSPVSLPASLPPAAGGRFRGPGGDDLTVDGAQQQHEPDGAEHLGGRYAMSLRDGHVQERCRHCRVGGGRSERWFQDQELHLKHCVKPSTSPINTAKISGSPNFLDKKDRLTKTVQEAVFFFFFN